MGITEEGSTFLAESAPKHFDAWQAFQCLFPRHDRTHLLRQKIESCVCQGFDGDKEHDLPQGVDSGFCLSSLLY